MVDKSLGLRLKKWKRTASTFVEPRADLSSDLLTGIGR